MLLAHLKEAENYPSDYDRYASPVHRLQYLVLTARGVIGAADHALGAAGGVGLRGLRGAAFRRPARPRRAARRGRNRHVVGHLVVVLGADHAAAHQLDTKL